MSSTALSISPLSEATPAAIGKLRSALHEMASAIESWVGDASMPAIARQEVEEILGACEELLRATVTKPDGKLGDTDGLSSWSKLGAVNQRAQMLVRSVADYHSAAGDGVRSDERMECLAQSVRNFDLAAQHWLSPIASAREGETSAASNREAEMSTVKGVILVVDDDRGNRDFLARRLLRNGREVMLAEGGRQALRMLARYQVDLILLDIMMPDMDGVEVLGALKSDSRLKHLPVIMITAVDDIESVVRCLEIGADDYIGKPFNTVVLRIRINSLLERKCLREAEQRKAEELHTALAGLKEERERASSLLLNILPPMIAEELQVHGSSEPMYFEDVTIVFADIVGFTLSIEQLPADVIVDILHRYFTAFDNIMSRYKLEKLKTIGDSYMYAGGIPVRSPSHPVDCVLAALEMINQTEELSRRGPVNWKIRIGVNTGPVIAGVVGIHKFAFDIWGDAVNMSSRMESCGEPNRVNLSAGTYMRVKDFFKCEKRERIRIKDGREVDTYLVSGIGASPRNGKVVPIGEAFSARYRTYFRRELTAFPDIPSGAPTPALEKIPGEVLQ